MFIQLQVRLTTSILRNPGGCRIVPHGTEFSDIVNLSEVRAGTSSFTSSVAIFNPRLLSVYLTHGTSILRFITKCHCASGGLTFAVSGGFGPGLIPDLPKKTLGSWLLSSGV